MNYWIALLALAGMALSAPASAQTAGVKPGYRIGPYIFGARTDLSRIPAERLTHINYAFARVNADGEAYLHYENSAKHLAQLQALKAKNPRFKVLISIGGAGADGYSDAALTAESREKFARSAIEMVKDYGLDGIDVNWEFPGHPGRGIKYRAEDKQNFTLLLETLRTHLDRLSEERGRTGDDRYLLSIATTDGWFFDNTEMDKAQVYLDHVNIMTYDIYGEGPTNTGPKTGHHAGLYMSDVPGAGPRTTVTFVEEHLAAGIPPQKLLLGGAFYGEIWKGVHPDFHGLNQPNEGHLYTRPYRVLVEEYIGKNGFERRWDDAAKAPFLWNPETRVWVSYDDAESLRAKVEYVKKQGLGGMMWWEQGGDYQNELLNAVSDAFAEPTP